MLRLNNLKAQCTQFGVRRSDSKNSVSLAGGIKLKLFLLMIIVGLVIFILPNIQVITDMILAKNVRLDGELATMASRLKLTSRAELILRASRPQLQTKQQFNQNCQRKEAATFILGCYNGRDIFIYDVNNQELEGISEVTLAHELLHAVYRRMTSKQRQELNQLLVVDYQRLKTPELERRMQTYDRTQPGQFENELHSILGTEFADLSEELEQHYRQVFKNRRVIVGLHQASQRPFQQKQQELERLKIEIATAEQSLKADQLVYQRIVESFNVEVEQFNQRATRVGGFTNQAEFQASRKQLMFRQQQLRQRQAELAAKINQFNQKVELYNQTGLAIQELNRSLDSLDSLEALKSTPIGAN